jgi:hypothetical protein
MLLLLSQVLITLLSSRRLLSGLLNEEGKKLKQNDYLNLSNWIHYLPGILKEGRISHFEIEAPEGIDQEEFMNKIKLADPFDSRMQTIADDKSILSVIPKVKIPAWKLQYVYDAEIILYLEVTDSNNIKDNRVNYTIICIRSLRWPRAYTIRLKGQNHNIYCGWEPKFPEYGIGKTFVYESFPNIPDDLADTKEQPEPNAPPKEKEEEEPKDGEEILSNSNLEEDS